MDSLIFLFFFMFCNNKFDRFSFILKRMCRVPNAIECLGSKAILRILSFTLLLKHLFIIRCINIHIFHLYSIYLFGLMWINLKTLEIHVTGHFLVFGINWNAFNKTLSVMCKELFSNTELKLVFFWNSILEQIHCEPWLSHDGRLLCNSWSLVSVFCGTLHSHPFMMSSLRHFVLGLFFIQM